MLLELLADVLKAAMLGIDAKAQSWQKPSVEKDYLKCTGDFHYGNDVEDTSKK